MSTHEVRAFFFGALDARMAMGDIRAAGGECSDPRPADEPQDGRPYMLVIEVDDNSPSSLYPSPYLADLIHSIVLRRNGAEETTKGT